MHPASGEQFRETDPPRGLTFSDWLERENRRAVDRVELSEAARMAEQPMRDALANPIESDSTGDRPDRGWARLGDAPTPEEVRSVAKVERIYRDLAPTPLGGLIDVMM